MIALAVLAYVAIAAALFVTQRGRWVRWFAAEFSILYRNGRGEVGAGWFLFTCAAWPVCFPMFLADARRTWQGDSFLDRYVKRGGA